MRTTIRMDDDLLEAVKSAALGAGQTLTSFIEDAIRRQLEIQHGILHSDTVSLPVFAGDGVLPGADLDRGAALLGLMDSER